MTWRVGLLVPSPNSVMEVDFYRSLPHDTSLHTSRLYMRDMTVESEERMLDEFVMPAVEALATVRPHIVVFGSMSAVLLRGEGYDRDLCERIGEMTGAVSISLMASVGQALRDTHASRVAVITPYADTMSQGIRAIIEAHQIDVSEIHDMGTSRFDIGSITAGSLCSFVQSRIGQRVPGDALFLEGTNCESMGALSQLKITYDVPIVTTNLAALHAVRQALYALRERELARSSVP
jgi:maleate isomerase